ncbi:MAG: (d)CMP kinase [Patescibacteria group bacterium]
MHEFQPKLSEDKEHTPLSFQIAIDGTVAAGKGSVSRLLADRLGFLYVDTGAMYRCVSYIAIMTHTPPENEGLLIHELKNHQILLKKPTDNEKDGRLITVLLNDEDVTWKIRTEQVSDLSSVTAQHLGIREELVRLQQHISASQDVVMEGRDITHAVLPNAQIKIFLDADPLVRAERRRLELQSRGIYTLFEDVLADLKIRDQRDFEKNMKRVPGVWDIDTTRLTTEEVVTPILFRTRTLVTNKS